MRSFVLVFTVLASGCSDATPAATDAAVDRPADGVPDASPAGPGCPAAVPTTGGSCGNSSPTTLAHACVYVDPRPAGELIGVLDRCVCESNAWRCEHLSSAAACPPTKPTPGNDPIADPAAGITTCFYYYPYWDGRPWIYDCSPCPAGGPCGPPWVQPGNWYCAHAGDADGGR
ncbi:MAG TPA: hypothetical protein VGQ83_24335 [Polyangia bacterium]